MRERALICRYGKQSFVDLAGHTMTALDQAVFAHCIIDLYNAEVKMPDTPSED